MQTTAEMKAFVMNKAAEDEEFRSRLIEDPYTAISSELGVEIPEGYNIVVHEDNASTTHMVLPPSAKLAEKDLAKVSGGLSLVVW